MSNLDLFGPQKSRAQRHADWLEALRAEVLKRHEGQEITTDEVWAIINSDEKFAKPADASPNILGRFFVEWNVAKPVMVTDDQQRTRVSVRAKARKNRLSVWRIVPDVNHQRAAA